MLRAAIARAREQLMAAGIDSGEAALDAELLARHVLGWDRATWLARTSEPAPSGFEPGYEAVLTRRLAREPMAYILGRQEFWGREFLVGPGVLIPRPETELLIEEALTFHRERSSSAPMRVVDIGTGSGCLAVTLALELGTATVHATEISPQALTLARRNAEQLQARVAFHLGAVLADVTPPVDLIVANPPYVTTDDYETLQPEVRLYEPAAALLGGDDGLDVVRQVLAGAVPCLNPGGRLLMEIGHDQAPAVRQLIAEMGPLDLVRIRQDLQGTPRAVVAERREGRR